MRKEGLENNTYKARGAEEIISNLLNKGIDDRTRMWEIVKVPNIRTTKVRNFWSAMTDHIIKEHGTLKKKNDK